MRNIPKANSQVPQKSCELIFKNKDNNFMSLIRNLKFRTGSKNQYTPTGRPCLAKDMIPSR